MRRKEAEGFDFQILQQSSVFQQLLFAFWELGKGWGSGVAAQRQGLIIQLLRLTFQSLDLNFQLQALSGFRWTWLSYGVHG